MEEKEYPAWPSLGRCATVPGGCEFGGGRFEFDGVWCDGGGCCEFDGAWCDGGGRCPGRAAGCRGVVWAGGFFVGGFWTVDCFTGCVWFCRGVAIELDKYWF